MSKVLLQRTNNNKYYETVEVLKNKTEAYKKLATFKKQNLVYTSAGFIFESKDGYTYKFVAEKNGKVLEYKASEVPTN